MSFDPVRLQSANRAARSLSSDPRRHLGRLGEDHAARHLQRLGFRVLARNVRTRAGEIDLIVFGGGVLLFVEVKTRCDRGRVGRDGCRSSPSPDPLEWLRPRQCARLRRLACSWLSDPGVTRPRAKSVRFDAIGVVLDPAERLLRLDHLEAAW